MSNFFPPTESEMLALLHLFAEGMKNNIKTYMHCHSGVDRTGIGAVLHRVFYEAWTIERAFEEWDREGRHWWFVWWKPIVAGRIKRVIRKLRP